MFKGKIQSKKGFYVGDICYVLDDEVYDGVWGRAGYADGEYTTELGKFAVASTAYGDGDYFDNYGNNYGVDAGVLGIVPWEILEKQNKWKNYYKGLSEMENLNKLGHFFEGTEAEYEFSGRDHTSPDPDGVFDIEIGETRVYIETAETDDDDGWDDLEYDDQHFYDEDDDYPDDYYDDYDDVEDDF